MLSARSGHDLSMGSGNSSASRLVMFESSDDHCNVYPEESYHELKATRSLTEGG